ncbi:unnamed protein product [Darwinula stevensoni]|uniref:Galactosylgalactosylxylosylprotein 3-beta-glucuronosyltransferase n=1 Tax=Darwinula stevensoni TaxID=69355 RepID=A0A7R9FQG6_9CRUS|nr:unnamed protein product [Darwinula stevensoni]CAG0899398.1 unnamed protein product [Darwinula stevensoni]
MKKVEAINFLYVLVLSTTVFLIFTYKELTETKSPGGRMRLLWNWRSVQESYHLAVYPCIESFRVRAHLPVIYVVTPTYPRPTQIPELVRLAQTLMTVPNLFWIVAEDAPILNPRVASYLDGTGICHAYLAAPMPESYRGELKTPRGVSNRRAGMDWIRKHVTEGVMYFADDDNTYHLDVFEEMRWTKKVSMWPVGLVTHLGVSSPVVIDGRVIGFYDGWIEGRKFPVDMAGFAVGIPFFLSKVDAEMPYRAGFEEDGFLRSLEISVDDVEPKADNCTKIYVWHTRTQKATPAPKIATNITHFTDSNLSALEKELFLETSESAFH